MTHPTRLKTPGNFERNTLTGGRLVERCVFLKILHKVKSFIFCLIFIKLILTTYISGREVGLFSSCCSNLETLHGYVEEAENQANRKQDALFRPGPSK